MLHDGQTIRFLAKKGLKEVEELDLNAFLGRLIDNRNCQCPKILDKHTNSVKFS